MQQGHRKCKTITVNDGFPYFHIIADKNLITLGPGILNSYYARIRSQYTSRSPIRLNG